MRKVRKKFSIKKTLRLIIPIVLLIVIIININNIIFFYQSKVTGYDTKSIILLHDLGLYNKVKKHEYSDTLEKVIGTEYFNANYLDNYLDIVWCEDNDFLNYINLLSKNGYNADEINIIYEKLSTDNIKLLLDNDYLKDISNILKLNYFYEGNFKRYILYGEKNDLDYVDLVTYVNIGLDNDYYTNVVNILDEKDTLVIVNKYNSLSSSYVPNDLDAIDSKYNKGSNNLMRHEAKVAFEKMCDAAYKDGIKIYSGSAYRSYNYQLNLYNRYVNTDGKTQADRYSARAGYSEHQTGLATDIMNANVDYLSSDDKEYQWLIDNSYKYGFILRYPKDKEKITGYMYEEWHFRYIGVNDAKKLNELDITYDEYVARGLVKNSWQNVYDIIKLISKRFWSSTQEAEEAPLLRV